MNKKLDQIDTPSPVGAQAVGVICAMAIGGLVGWAIDSPAGMLIGIAAGALIGIVLTGPIIAINKGQVQRATRGAFIGVVIWVAFAVIDLVSSGTVSAATFIMPLLGIVWGAVVFADIRTAVIWGVRGALLGLGLAVPIGIIAAVRLGSEVRGLIEWLTVGRVLSLTVLLAVVSALMVVSVRLFVGELFLQIFGSHIESVRRDHQ